MKQLILIFLLLFTVGSFSDLKAQSGGRKREHKNQNRGSSKFKGKKSAGNADAFARGGSNKRTSKKRRETSWVYRPTATSKKQKKEQRFLFSRYRTKGRKQRDGILTQQNSSRSKGRVRGNKVFHKRKY